MITIERIAEDMGDIWVEREKERARRNYDRMGNRDVSKREYVNASIRHAYACIQQANLRVNKGGEK